MAIVNAKPRTKLFLSGLIAWLINLVSALNIYLLSLDGDWSSFQFPIVFTAFITSLLSGLKDLNAFLADGRMSVPNAAAQSDTESTKRALEASAPPEYRDVSAGPAPIAKNWFSDVELDCKCIDEEGCNYTGMDATVLLMANRLRNHFGPLTVNSGYRCPIHNKNVGGVPDSYHVKAMAIDLRSPTATPAEMYAWLDAEYPQQYGIGLYKTFVHCDSRTEAWARKPAADQPWKQFAHRTPDVELA